MSIYDRFARLPRARRGDETIILVPESELAALIGDAQASEARLFKHGGMIHSPNQPLHIEEVVRARRNPPLSPESVVDLVRARRRGY